MARQGWGSLSAGYKNRLERSGISRSDYESGASLKGARGHSHTPENPSEAERHPGKYKEYRARRKAIIDAVYDVKKAQYGNTPGWNAKTAIDSLNKGPGGKPWTIAELREMAKKAEEAIAEDADLYSKLSESDLKDAANYH